MEVGRLGLGIGYLMIFWFGRRSWTTFKGGAFLFLSLSIDQRESKGFEEELNSKVKHRVFKNVISIGLHWASDHRV